MLPLRPALFFCILSPCLAFAQASTLPPKLAESIFAQSGEVHIVGVSQDDDHQMRWVTWGERTDQNSLAHLAMVAQDGSGVHVVSAIQRPDAYAPNINTTLPWHDGQHPVIAWTYQYGASVQTLEIYALNAQNQLIKRAERTGEAIGWRINSQGTTQAVVYAHTGKRLTATCYEWQDAQHRLTSKPCD